MDEMICPHTELRVQEYPEDMQYHPAKHPQVYIAEKVCVSCGKVLMSRAGFTALEAREWLAGDWTMWYVAQARW